LRILFATFGYIASTEDDSIIDKFFKLVIPSEEREKKQSNLQQNQK